MWMLPLHVNKKSDYDMILYEYIIIIKWYLFAINFLFITKENKTQTLFSVSFILVHFIAYIMGPF